MPGSRTGGLFDLFPATPGTIAELGADLTSRASGITRVRDAVDTAARAALQMVEGSLLGPVQAVSRPSSVRHDELAGAALVAAGAMTLWARHVETFDTGVSRLNERWAAGAASGFGVAAPRFNLGMEPEERDGIRAAHADDVAAARAALLAQLQREYAVLDGDLDADAAAVAALLDEGPTTATVLTLLRAGALPASALSVFPAVNPSAGDLRAMVASLQRYGLLESWLQPPAGASSMELLVQLDAARGAGLAPTAYKDLLEAYWNTVALEKAGIDPALWDPSLGAQQLAPIIEAVYRYYGDLYLAHPELQWAGMAAMIGPSFAAGFQDLALMRDVADAANGPVEELPVALQALLPLQLQSLNVLSQLSEEDIEFYETTFLEMQKEIFFDQASMHEAYLGGGMDAIQEMYDAGLLSGSEGRAVPEQALDSWRQIDEGLRTGDSALLAEGNTGLLYREQAYIIDNEYQDMKSHGITGPALTYLMGAIGGPSIPGARSLAEVDPLSVHIDPTPDGPWGIPNPIPSLEADIDTPLPAGNIADFETRWELITSDTLPRYQELLATDPELARQLIAADVGGRIDEYRLQNRIDDIVWDLATNWDIDLSAGW